MREETSAERYIRCRKAFREKAANDFLTKRPRANLLVATATELVANLTYFSTDKDIRPIKNGHYINDLIASFCRSQFAAADFVIYGELVEAATIIRKQMELLARLKELSAGEALEDLIGDTPNVRHLMPNLRKLYGEYSAIAHSSTPQKLQLLGEVEKDGLTYTPLYPLFDENAYVALNHLIILTFEFALWAMDFYRRELAGYDSGYDEDLFKSLAQLAVAEYARE
jgi:hypothetical protein